MLTLPARARMPPSPARAWRSDRIGEGPIGPPTLTLWSAMVLMAERIFLITEIVFGIVVPIAVMVALVYMK